MVKHDVESFIKIRAHVWSGPNYGKPHEFLKWKKGISKNRMPTQLGIPFFETPSKQLRGITLGKVPCTYTKEMGLGCYGGFLLVPHFLALLLDYFITLLCSKMYMQKSSFLVHLLKYVYAWDYGKLCLVCLVPSQWVKPTSRWWTLFPKHRGSTFSYHLV